MGEIAFNAVSNIFVLFESKDTLKFRVKEINP
jgi:hypothetical protein